MPGFYGRHRRFPHSGDPAGGARGEIPDPGPGRPVREPRPVAMKIQVRRTPNGPDGAAGKGTPTSGQFSRWGPAQRPGGPRRRRPQPVRDGAVRKGTPTSGRHSGPEGRGGADPTRSGMAPSARERRPPVGTAARRAAAAQTPPGPGWRRPQGNADLRSAQRPGGPRRRRPHPVRDGAVRKGTPTSGRHSGPEGRGGADPTRSGMAPSARERRPPVGTRGSAKPAPMTSGSANVSAAPPLR